VPVAAVRQPSLSTPVSEAFSPAGELLYCFPSRSSFTRSRRLCSCPSPIRSPASTGYSPLLPPSFLLCDILTGPTDAPSFLSLPLIRATVGCAPLKTSGSPVSQCFFSFILHRSQSLALRVILAVLPLHGYFTRLPGSPSLRTFFFFIRVPEAAQDEHVLSPYPHFPHTFLFPLCPFGLPPLSPFSLFPVFLCARTCPPGYARSGLLGDNVWCGPFARALKSRSLSLVPPSLFFFSLSFFPFFTLLFLSDCPSPRIYTPRFFCFESPYFLKILEACTLLFDSSFSATRILYFPFPRKLFLWTCSSALQMR